MAFLPAITAFSALRAADTGAHLRLVSNGRPSSPDGIGGRPRRDALRERWKARVPRWYSPFFHLTCNVIVVTAVVAFLLSEIAHHGVKPAAWLAIPATFLLANALEYALHRYPMHRRNPWLERMFRRHTLQHHRFFTHTSMAITSKRDLFFIMFPVQYGVISVLIASGVVLGVGAVTSPGAAALAGITLIVYFLCLDLFHLVFHLPLRWFRRVPVLKGKIVRYLRWHHLVHHDPRLMNKWNFNITLPITDWILGTAYRGSFEEDLDGDPDAVPETP